ncbi:MAG: putative metal-binding protein [Colwellia sp.]|jgi:predicted metal-binding protein
MIETASPEPKKESQTSTDNARTSVLHVCTSCRALGSVREPIEKRAGFKLYQALRTMFNESKLSHQVEVKPTECLSLCPRPCAIAFSSAGAWSYLFGDQHPEKSAGDIVECIALYLDTPEGIMPRKTRPKTLRGSILGRVPPFDIAANISDYQSILNEGHSVNSANKRSKFYEPTKNTDGLACL